MENRPDASLKWTALLFVVLLVNTAYISAFASPTIFYMLNVLLHLVLGVALAVTFTLLLARRPELRAGIVPAAVLFLLALLAGVWLAVDGNVLQNRPVYWTHVGAAGLGLAALGAGVWRRGAAGGGWGRSAQDSAAAWVLLAVFAAATAVPFKRRPDG